MPTRFVITANNNPEILHDVGFKDGVKEYSFDFSPWADDNGTVTSVTWTVKSGQASVSNTALASNVATGRLTFSEGGRSLIQIKATNGDETTVAHLNVLVKDPQVTINDYGLGT